MRGDSTESQFGSLRVAWLQAFVLTVDYDKRTAAALELKIGQGTVTKHISKLERWLGGGPALMLLHPEVWPPRLTEAGKAFLPVAREMLRLAEAARGIKPDPTGEGREAVNTSATARSSDGPRPSRPSSG